MALSGSLIFVDTSKAHHILSWNVNIIWIEKNPDAQCTVIGPKCPIVAAPAANKLTYWCPGPDGAAGEGLPEEHEGDHGRGGAAPHVPGGGAPQRRPARPRHPRHHHGRSWSCCHEVTQSRCPAQVRKRNPSPSPSAVSSSSSTPSHYSAPGPEADKRLTGSYLAQAPNKFGE